MTARQWLRGWYRIIRWRCCDCGKRHISTWRQWSKHIDFDVPLCFACQDREWVGYNESMLREGNTP